jgi:uncharacterized membrane protein YgaE (UPF0421/DUF939 family)
MTEKTIKFWNSPTVIIGVMVALIVVAVAVLYFFYTKLVHCKVKTDVLEKKVADLQSTMTTARTKADGTIAELQKTVGALQDKVKKIKSSKTSSPPPKKVKCDDNSCVIEDL